jgi:electron transfer flavoprotein alpha subunit
METILVLAHTEADGSLGKAALETLGAAKTLSASLAGSTLVVGLIGAEVQAAANQIAAAGATRLLGVAGADFAQPRYSSDVLAVEALGKAAAATIILAPATSRMNRVLAGATQRLGGRIDTHATGIAAADGKPAVTRWYYRQRMEAVLSRTQRPWVVALESGCSAAFAGAAAKPASNSCPLPCPPRINAPPSPHPGSVRRRADDPPDAKLLFVAGAGWTKKQADGQAHAAEAEQIILGFLGQTKSSLGSTKSLVDLSGEGQQVLKFMSHLNQVGQTGSTPRHAKGLATCCHGEEPHTVGWRFINERRAINLNAACSWAQGKADVLYVADAFAVMRKVNELLAAK